jgi:hypothetical protein
MNRTTSIVSVSVIAGPIAATSQPVHPRLGQQVALGDDLYLHITAEVAQQWISVLEPIAGEK